MSASADHSRVLLCTSSSKRLEQLKQALLGVGLRGVRVGASIESSLQETLPSAAVVDAARSTADALEICGKLLGSTERAIPVLVLLAPGDTATLLRGRTLGIRDFAEDPSSSEVLALRVQAMLEVAEESDRREIERRAPEQPGRDDLTGLSNRPSFLEGMDAVVERARSAGHHAALLYLDIDRFKAVNDALGHAVGDVLLQHVARILEDQVRATDLVQTGASAMLGDASRLGGDEFTVLLSKVNQPEHAGEVARRILAAMRDPIMANGYQLASTASIGIAIFPQDGRDPETLLRCADMAMYAAKAEGRGRFRFYEPSMGAVHHRRLEVEQHLRTALHSGELEVHYQPRIDLGVDSICGVEALVRWRSPVLGEVQPKEFIPIAEECGLIVPIGDWVLETACTQLDRWREKGLEGLRLSVNISSRQFTSSDVLRTVTDILRRTRIDPHALELEVTERLMLGADEETALALRDLRGIGVTIALDDFGTGYSSLSSITRYPLDVLKIDRSIAAQVEEDPAAESIVSAIVTLARSLGLGVVAEGVDSAGQARVLTRLGCEELQGFLVTPALEADALEQFWRDWRGIGQCSGPADVPDPG
jgi:diguanylate cyclase (GGDEF)-like protein